MEKKFELRYSPGFSWTFPPQTVDLRSAVSIRLPFNPRFAICPGALQKRAGQTFPRRIHAEKISCIKQSMRFHFEGYKFAGCFVVDRGMIFLVEPGIELFSSFLTLSRMIYELPWHFFQCFLRIWLSSTLSSKKYKQTYWKATGAVWSHKIVLVRLAAWLGWMVFTGGPKTFFIAQFVRNRLSSIIDTFSSTYNHLGIL